MGRSFFILAALVPGILSACGASSVVLGESWKRVEFEPEEFYGPLNIIEFNHGALRFNSVQLSEVGVLAEIRKETDLMPRPVVYLRFSRSEYGDVSALAKGIRDAGGCAEVECLFKITGP